MASMALCLRRDIIMIRHQLWWDGHLAQMSANRLSKQILFSLLASGKRPTSSTQGSVQKHLAADRNRSDQLGARSCRKNQMEKNYPRKKTSFENRVQMRSQNSPSFKPSCPTVRGCGPLFVDNIVLISHGWKCRWANPVLGVRLLQRRRYTARRP